MAHSSLNERIFSKTLSAEAILERSTPKRHHRQRCEDAVVGIHLQSQSGEPTAVGYGTTHRSLKGERIHRRLQCRFRQNLSGDGFLADMR